jgi:uncharacterized cupin superfamily protein
MEIIKLNPTMPAADLIPLPPLPPEIIEGGTSPVTAYHTYFKDLESSLSIGVWTATPYARRSRPHVCHEFMLLLEGEIALIGADGTEIVVRAPDAVVLPKGLPCAWKQSTSVRKFYMTLAGESAASSVSSPVGISRTEALAPLAAGVDGALRAGRLDYTDPSGRFRVGQWESAAFKAAPAVYPKHELLHITGGSVTLTVDGSEAQTFAQGDTVFVPQGTRVGWRCDQYVKKIFCSFSSSPV